MEPHVFCGPEFVLALPKDRQGDLLVVCSSEGCDGTETCTSSLHVRDEVLLRIQSELFRVCSVGLRRLLHATWARTQGGPTTSFRTSALQSQPIPEPPEEIIFVEVRAPSQLSTEEQASIAHSCKLITSHSTPTLSPGMLECVSLLMLITDSRVAAELYMLSLKNGFIALPSSCRLHVYYRVNSRAISLSPAEILAKRLTLLSHYNIDADLWSALEDGLPRELVDRLRAEGEHNGYEGSRLLTPQEKHEQRVAALLRYCEDYVQYAGVLDLKEEASPFLQAMGLFFQLHLTAEDLLFHFVSHPRRIIRALALFIARYTVAPEGLVPFYESSIRDAVIISCTADMAVTTSMENLCRDLLCKDEVCEAWLPAYHRYWSEHVVQPLIAYMERKHDEREAAKHLRQTGHSEPSHAEVGREQDHTLTKAAANSIHGSGCGVGRFGFRSLKEINTVANQRERTLVPQRMATLVAHRRGVAFDTKATDQESDASDRDAMDSNEEFEDDFLIDVEVAGSQPTLRGPLHPRRARDLGESVSEPSPKRRKRSEAVDIRKIALHEGYSVVLKLQGRTKPFDPTDERYMEF